MSEYGAPPPPDPRGSGSGGNPGGPDKPPQAPQYGQPGQPPYGQPPQAPQYGQPSQSPYDQSPYGQPGQMPYGQPEQVGYGQPAYGQPGSPIPPGIQFASMGRRLGARAIDSLLMFIVIFVLFLMLGGLWFSGGGADNIVINEDGEITEGGEEFFAAYLGFVAVVLLLGFLYEFVMIALRGATLGKMMLGVKVVRVADGQAPGWMPSFLRFLIPAVGNLACGVGQILVYISPFFDSSGRNQGWHDQVAKTVVIRT